LAFIVPVWLYVFGSALGGTREEVLATFARPFPAILSALVLVIGMRHFAMGATTMIEDYLHGTAKKMAIIFAVSLAWMIGAAGIFALAKIAL
jgi:succinate dehydrogenase / fumarate reductase membrane anchor subunit